MDGYEFESLIETLLKKMDFIVEHTPLSRDGGVDLIASTNKPIFKGQYLIQCKYWSSRVGEPAVRDLYGTVLARNANKGIIITNSTFSDKAIEFADNKNLELIDGNTLNSLLNKYVKGNKLEVLNTKSFIDFSEFEVDKYKYLRKRIEQDKSNKPSYESLLRFYFDQLNTPQFEILKAGLLDEMVNFINEYTNRFCKRTKTLLNEKKAIQLILSNIYMLKGELSTSLELMKDIGIFKKIPNHELHGAITDYLPEYWGCDWVFFNSQIIKEKNTSFRNLIFLNWYQIFNKISYSDGINFFDQWIERFQEFTIEIKKELDFFDPLGMKVYQDNIKSGKILLNQLRDNKFDVYYLPTNYRNDSKDWFVESKDKTLSTSNLFENLLDENKLKSQIPELDIILNAIQSEYKYNYL